MRMLGRYGFRGLDAESCFCDSGSGSLYFPVLDSVETPEGIMAKTEEMVDGLLHMYYFMNGCRMETGELYLNAVVKVNPAEKKMGIHVKISDYDSLEDHVAEKKYSIWRGNPLYGQFKSYFMRQLEKELFGE